jgi:hypothetical protein
VRAVYTPSCSDAWDIFEGSVLAAAAENLGINKIHEPWLMGASMSVHTMTHGGFEDTVSKDNPVEGQIPHSMQLS